MVSALSTHCRSSANMKHYSLLLFLRPRFSTAGTSRSSFHPRGHSPNFDFSFSSFQAHAAHPNPCDGNILIAEWRQASDRLE